MTKIHTASPEETHALGMRLAARIEPGDVITLSGDMGTGKSVMARGIARGLGVTGYVPSPSFTIMQAHTSGRLPLYHFDWYRLCGAQELYELSMEEYLLGDGVAVVEWPEAAPEALPERRLEIEIAATGDNEREICMRALGGHISPEGLDL